MSRPKTSFGVIGICLAACVCFGSAAFSQNAATQSGENCKAPAAPRSLNGNGMQQKDTDITGSTTLSDCNGVLKPPEAGDSTLVPHAPPSSNMPVVKPGDLPPQQQNAK